MAAVIEGVHGDENESSWDSFWWYGDEDGVAYKPNAPVSGYLPSDNLHTSPTPFILSCSRASAIGGELSFIYSL